MPFSFCCLIHIFPFPYHIIHILDLIWVRRVPFAEMAEMSMRKSIPINDKCKGNNKAKGRSKKLGDGNSHKLPQPNWVTKMRKVYLQLSMKSNAKANYLAYIKSGINGNVRFRLGFNRCIQTPVIMMVVLIYLQLESNSFVV